MALKFDWSAGSILIALVLLLTLWTLRGFFVPLTWAGIIALSSWPLYRRFAARLPARFASHVTPLLFTALMTLLVLGPFVFAVAAVAGQVQGWSQTIVVADKQGLAPPDWLTDFPFAGAWLEDQWRRILARPGGVSRWLQREGSAAVVGWAQSLGQLVLHHVLIISFTILALFFLYRGGVPLEQQVRRVVHDKLGARGDAYFQQMVVAVRATVGGTLVVAALDGVLLGLAYAAAGVPSAVVWGAVTGLFAMIPYLAYVAVGAIAVALSVHGAGTAAVALCGFSVAVIFASDKFIRPALTGRASHLGFFWVLLGGLGGLETFGLLGIFIGPVLLASAIALWREWSSADRGS